jgi:ChAPs (Chs5p-Arf1p-binding proteins)
MAAAMKQTPHSYTLLHVQCDFLRSKGQNQWALKLARQAVNCAPSEFVTWEKLADIYIDLTQYDSVWLFHALFPLHFVFLYSSLGTFDTQLMSDVYIQRP